MVQPVRVVLLVLWAPLALSLLFRQERLSPLAGRPGLQSPADQLLHGARRARLPPALQQVRLVLEDRLDQQAPLRLGFPAVPQDPLFQEDLVGPELLEARLVRVGLAAPVDPAPALVPNKTLQKQTAVPSRKLEIHARENSPRCCSSLSGSGLARTRRHR